jgi:hypothetical protein
MSSIGSYGTHKVARLTPFFIWNNITEQSARGLPYRSDHALVLFFSLFQSLISTNSTSLRTFTWNHFNGATFTMLSLRFSLVEYLGLPLTVGHRKTKTYCTLLNKCPIDNNIHSLYNVLSFHKYLLCHALLRTKSWVQDTMVILNVTNSIPFNLAKQTLVTTTYVPQSLKPYNLHNRAYTCQYL